MQWIKDIKNETEYNRNRTFYSSCMQENNDQELHQQISTEFQLTYHEITFLEGFSLQLTETILLCMAKVFLLHHE